MNVNEMLKEAEAEFNMAEASKDSTWESGIYHMTKANYWLLRALIRARGLT